jgi:hypothetical protein
MSWRRWDVWAMLGTFSLVFLLIGLIVGFWTGLNVRL